MESIEDKIFYSVLVFMWIVYVWESYISSRQRHLAKTVTEVPDSLKDVLDQDTFTKARLYSLDKSNFGFWSGLYSQCESTVILLLGGIPFAWNLAGKWLGRLGYDADYEILQSLTFMVITMIFSTVTSLALEPIQHLCTGRKTWIQ
ncbi:hypothetical protein FSP39_007367 [Pinctada imbricata]|uniref:CAAX prenyl protease 1 N-terminal domain-containing protein n=1 Tax=Pinctada imbricata TaxID=66713 RepID=A0AA88XSY4_PINIB|nr:hypothetical protein FSP39_007367 [Pinctada imbricata]